MSVLTPSETEPVTNSPVFFGACYVHRMTRKARSRRRPATTFEQIPVATIRRRLALSERSKSNGLAGPPNMIVESMATKSEPRSMEFWLARPERRMVRR